jgi:hypothetical protein
MISCVAVAIASYSVMFPSMRFLPWNPGEANH